MEAHKSDLLIMGCGLAGLQAAVAAARAGGPRFRVTLLSCASENAYGGCSYKTHGTNAAMNVGDDVQDHILDTWNGGGRLGDLALIQEMCRRVPAEIRALERLGVVFDRGDDGQYLAGYYGGSTRPRSVHRSDMAGKAMVDVLLAEAQKRGVYILHQRQTLGLIMAQGVCSGAYVLNLATGEVESFEATNTISALGGGACVYPIATISADKTSAGIVQAYEAGAGLVDMEMVQFHPTGLNKPNGPGHGEILEEELRSMGARFINGVGERYMPRYDERAERATRDVVARGTYAEIIEGRGTANNGVVLDLSCIDKDTLLARFPFMVQRARSYGVDLIAQDQVETSPAAHFLMGGIKIDSSGGTEIANLYACGEDAGGIHGGNRLGGNGVADALVFGRIAGEAAAGRGASTLGRRFDPHYVPTYVGIDAAAARGVVSELKQLMWECAGPVRKGSDLVRARKGITQIEDRLSSHRQLVPVENFHLGDLEGRLLVQRLTLARMIVQSAIAREDSVGSHYRVDATQSRCTYNVRVSSKADGSMGVERRYVDQSRPEVITTIHGAIEDGPVTASA